MTFKTAWNNFWRKRLNITDRATRLEYWPMFSFCFVLPYLFAIYLFNFAPINWWPVLVTIYGTFLVVTLIPFITLTMRRYNDMGLPAWIPLVVIGINDAFTILSVFLSLNLRLPLYITDHLWLAYIFVLGACIAPSAANKK